MVYVFGDCELDVRRFELRRQGMVRPMEPQVFDVLVLLLRERDRVVTKAEILDTVWSHRFVSESALTSRIKSVRQAVGDDGATQHIVRTVRRRGYQFVADVTERADQPTPPRRPVRCRNRRPVLGTLDEIHLTHATIGSERAAMTAANPVRHLDEDDTARRRAGTDPGVEAADRPEPMQAGEQANDRRREDDRDRVIRLPQRAGDRAPG